MTSAAAEAFVCRSAPVTSAVPRRPVSRHGFCPRRTLRRRGLGGLDRPRARRVHPHPQQVSRLRPRLGRARLHGRRRHPHRALVPGAGHPRDDARGGQARGPHAAGLHRGPGRRRRDRAALRAPRQAARDDRVARGPRPVDAGARGRAPVRARRRGRRLCRLRLAHGAARARRAGTSPRAVRRHHRGVRGERELRSPPLHRRARRSARGGRPRHLPRLRVRELRSALVHHIPARPGGRQPERRAPRGRCPFRRRERHRALVVPGAPPAPRPHRGPRHRADARAGAPRRDPRGPSAPGPGGRAGPRRRGLQQVPLARRRPARDDRAPRARAQPHLAAGALGDRRPPASRRSPMPATCPAR